MKGWALLLTVVLYCITAWDYGRQGDLAMAIAFVCYAIANVCFWTLLR